MTLLDYLYGEPDAMSTATAKKPDTAKRTTIIHVPEGRSVVVRRVGNFAEMQEACRSLIDTAKADTRKGDAAAFLREFRKNPRA